MAQHYSLLPKRRSPATQKFGRKRSKADIGRDHLVPLVAYCRQRHLSLSHGITLAASLIRSAELVRVATACTRSSFDQYTSGLRVWSLALDRKKLAAFSALGGGFLRFPIGDRRCNRRARALAMPAGTRAQAADPRHLRLLRARRERPRGRRAAECGQQFPPSNAGHGRSLPPDCRTLSLPQLGSRVL